MGTDPITPSAPSVASATMEMGAGLNRPRPGVEQAFDCADDADGADAKYPTVPAKPRPKNAHKNLTHFVRRKGVHGRLLKCEVARKTLEAAAIAIVSLLRP